MRPGNHSPAEVFAQLRKESARVSIAAEALGLTTLSTSGAVVADAEALEEALRGRFDDESIGRGVSALERAGREEKERQMQEEEREVYESPNWFRPGTPSYFAEAQAAGYYGVDESTGEAFRAVSGAVATPGSGSHAKPASPKRGSLVWSDVAFEPYLTTYGPILVRANLPHIDEQTDGMFGPIVDLAYHWEGPGPLRSGMVVWCPPTPNGPQVDFPAVVVTTNPDNIDYKGPMKSVTRKLPLSAAMSDGDRALWNKTNRLIHEPASGALKPVNKEVSR